ncbi:MAG: acyl carrier protein [Bdellovibrionales bacterium]
MDQIKTFVEDQMRHVLEQQTLPLNEETILTGLPGWDSVKMLSLLVTIEKKFKVTFHAREVTNLKTHGELLRLVAAKMAQ